jgi:hypothetical protein
VLQGSKRLADDPGQWAAAVDVPQLCGDVGTPARVSFSVIEMEAACFVT